METTQEEGTSTGSGAPPASVNDLNIGNPQMATTTTTRSGKDEEEDEDTVVNTPQRKRVVLERQHTLDESDLCEYPPAVQTEILSALKVHGKEQALRVGVVLHDTGNNSEGHYRQKLQQTLLRAIPSLISQCKLVALAVLDGDSQEVAPEQAAKQWLDDNAAGYPILAQFFHPPDEATNDENEAGADAHHNKPILLSGQSYSRVRFYHGTDGYQAMLEQQAEQEHEVDAVYVLCPTSGATQSQLVLQALKAEKHVLVHDVRSTTLADFQQQAAAAAAAHRFVQFSTMFVQHYRVQTFLDSVAFRLDNITDMHMQLHVHPSDWAHVGVVGAAAANHAAATLEQLHNTGDNCIRRLARYGVLYALLLLQQRANRQPVSVEITHSETNRHGLVVQAQGVVKFSHGCQFTFDVAYSDVTCTRQWLEVHASHRYAIMNDLVVPQRADGLATFRIYDKTQQQVNFWAQRASHANLDDLSSNSNHKESLDLQVTGGDAVDVVSRPPAQVMTWRTFAQLCRAVEQDDDNSRQTTMDPLAASLQQEAALYTRTTLQLKSILNQLELSQEQDHVELPMTPSGSSSARDLAALASLIREEEAIL